MTNLDLMKQSIISQIDQMSAEDFEKFVDLLGEVGVSSDAPELNFDEIFTCERCRKEFSLCHPCGDNVENPTSECHQKFIEYASRTV